MTSLEERRPENGDFHKVICFVVSVDPSSLRSSQSRTVGLREQTRERNGTVTHSSDEGIRSRRDMVHVYYLKRLKVTTAPERLNELKISRTWVTKQCVIGVKGTANSDVMMNSNIAQNGQNSSPILEVFLIRTSTKEKGN
ncbi:hypothetical protein KIN20_034294 [Parelaphostrongylus tenuis]|uniref:Uncharacterized protein n=1 Tax=Parelaphostrongylus tenuis TaxID=148309 RepID=A0AAD5WJ41_PARTN|nr:hypothetical protein KIN20_034294 [Parelaphostrongylus tenuis]